MAKDKIKNIYNKHKKKISLSCCEYHSHSAAQDCLDGPTESIEICILYEKILDLRNSLQKIKEICNGKDD